MKFDENDINFLADMIRSQGWGLYKKQIEEQVANYRQLATQQKSTLEDRLWNSAMASGLEQAVVEISGIVSRFKK